MADNTRCSKCSGVLDTEGYPRWCNGCRTSYKRELSDLKMAKKEAAGFAAGVRACKDALADGFDDCGSGSFSGYEIAEMIRRAPGPLVES